MSVDMDQQRDVERARDQRQSYSMVVCEEGVRSTAAVASHPMHPMLNVFPISFVLGALVTDVAYAIDGDPFWARASLWLLGAGLATGVVAAILGLIDFATIRRVRESASGWVHGMGNIAIIVVVAANFLLRTGSASATANVVPTGLILSAITGAVLLVTAWLGGELSYRHKIGVIECRPGG
jgi:uncharacterized membrane protein